MEYKEEYRTFCRNNKWVPLFHQPYWWDTVTSHWDVVKLKTEFASAYLPYTTEKKLGFTLSRNPHLTPYSGLLYFDPHYSTEEKQKMQQLAIDFLERFALSEYDGNPLLSKNTTGEQIKRTYLLELNQPADEIHNNFKSSLRRQLKKAEKSLVINEQTNIDNFYPVYQASLKRQKASLPIAKETISKTLTLCLEKGIGTIYEAQDHSGNVHAAIFNVWDEQCSYYLIGGSDGAYMGSGAMGLLLWHCVQQAKHKGQQYFDFEGSEVAGVARFFSTFGGQELFYPVLAGKTDPKLKTLLKLKGKLGL